MVQQLDVQPHPINFLYSIGGDPSTITVWQDQINTTLNSIESASISVFGQMGSWVTQRNTLPGNGCTYSCAVTVGQFVYLLCGNNGTGATNSVFRAQVLDPLATPTIQSVSISVQNQPPNNSFVGGGSFNYGVSAVYPANDTSNPGETLTGENFIIFLPNSNTLTFSVNLQWDLIPNAVSYRIYRSVNGTSASIVGFIGEVSTNSFTDTGITASYKPLGSGGLGVWLPVSSLNIPRGWSSCLALQSTSSANNYTIYVFGGVPFNTSNSALASYEYLPITIIPKPAQTKLRESHVVGNWAMGTTNLTVARYGASAVLQTSDTLSYLNFGQNAIYIGVGLGANSVISTVIDTAYTMDNGSLNFVATTFSGGPGSRYGYCMFPFVASGSELGFMGGDLSSAQGKAGIYMSVTSFSTNWNAGWSATAARLTGCVVESPFLFITGGVLNSGVVTQTFTTNL